MKTTFQFKGGKELADRLQDFTEELRNKILKESQREAAKIVKAKAIELAPEDTGRLKHFIAGVTFYASRNDQIITKVGIVAMSKAIAKKDKLTSGAWYARFPEKGTKRQRAQNFMLRAIEATKEMYVERLVEVAGRKIDRYLSKYAKGS